LAEGERKPTEQQSVSKSAERIPTPFAFESSCPLHSQFATKPVLNFTPNSRESYRFSAPEQRQLPALRCILNIAYVEKTTKVMEKEDVEEARNLADKPVNVNAIGQVQENREQILAACGPSHLAS
jgi:hypothetical protein